MAGFAIEPRVREEHAQEPRAPLIAEVSRRKMA